MKGFKIVILMLILFISLGAACAAQPSTGEDSIDANSNDLETSQNDIYSENKLNNTFTDLNELIKNSGNVLEIDRDYKYSNDIDYRTRISIAQNDFTINGNNHILDGSNLTRIFHITGKNVIINDLVFISGYAKNEGGAIYNLGQLRLNNVTFISNYAGDSGGAISNMDNGTLECYEARFIDNYAEIGSAVHARRSMTQVSDAYISSKSPNKFGQISVLYCELDLDNITFEDTVSSYAPALYIRNSNCTIVNSRFRNLTGQISAGAIAIKSSNNIHIENCEFINTRSSKNAGAINADILGSEETNGTVVILDCLFKDTSSSFGGAYIQLGGTLLMNNTNFTNGRAGFNGGSLYLSHGNCTIGNCTFDSNGVEIYEDYPTYGGAIYADNCTLTITHSRLINNTAYLGDAIYGYDLSCFISNSTFSDNVNDIFTYFDKKTDIRDNTYSSNDSISLNNTFYPSCVEGTGMELTLLNNTINVTTLPSRFDLRDWGWVSPVRDQGRMGACWAFGSTGALESAFLKTVGIATDFSENNMQNTGIEFSIYGSPSPEGGAYGMYLNYLLTWLGAFPQDADTYDEIGKISPLIRTNNDVHIQDAIFILNNDVPDGTPLKSAILKYGSLCVNYYAQPTYDPKNPWFNDRTSAQYCNKSIGSNHVVSIVGWDDNYPKENFIITPPGDGAWIVKNSWDTDWGRNGYFYLSYYDKTLLGNNKSVAVGFVIENTVPYNKNYQYDYISYLITFKNSSSQGNSNFTFANQFEALDDDLIAAVGTFFKEADCRYEIGIYVNDKLKLVQEGISPYYGYQTIKLNSYIPVKEGDIFKVVMTSKFMPYTDMKEFRWGVAENSSFIYDANAGEWYDFFLRNNSIANIKVYTVAGDSRLDTEIISNTSMAVLVTDLAEGTSRFNLTLVSDDTALANKTVSITFNGETGEFTTDENGMISYEMPVASAGSYTIDMEFEGDADYMPSNASASVNVIKEQSKIYLRNALYFVTQTKMVRVTLWDSKDNPIAGKTVYISMYDQKYSGITDENGDAYIRVGVGYGNHTATVSFEEDGEYLASNRTGVIRVIKETPSLMLPGAYTIFKAADSTKTIKVYLKDRYDKPLLPGTKVFVTINGKQYVGSIDTEGIASININLNKAGVYNVELYYTGNTAYNAVKRTTKITIT